MEKQSTTVSPSTDIESMLTKLMTEIRLNAETMKKNNDQITATMSQTNKSIAQNNAQINEKINKTNKTIQENNLAIQATIDEKLTKNNAEVKEIIQEKFTVLETQHNALTNKLTSIENNVQQIEINFREELVKLDTRMQESLLKYCTESDKRNEEFQMLVLDQITAAKDIMRTEVMAVHQEVTTLDQGLNKIRATTNQLINKQEQLAEQVSYLKDRPQINGTLNTTTDRDNIPRMQDYRTNPMEYLRNLKELLEYREITNWKIIKKIINESCTQQTEIWWYVCKDTLNSFSEFEAAFKARYWNELHQNIAREKILAGHYNPNRGQSMTEYFLDRVLLARNFDPPLSEITIVSRLAQHFNECVRLARLSSNANTVEKFEQLLLNFDANQYFERTENRREKPFQNENKNNYYTENRRGQTGFNQNENKIISKDQYNKQSKQRNPQQYRNENNNRNFGNKDRYQPYYNKNKQESYQYQYRKWEDERPSTSEEKQPNKPNDQNKSKNSEN
jgi:hypothetical protein